MRNWPLAFRPRNWAIPTNAGVRGVPTAPLYGRTPGAIPLHHNASASHQTLTGTIAMRPQQKPAKELVTRTFAALNEAHATTLSTNAPRPQGLRRPVVLLAPRWRILCGLAITTSAQPDTLALTTNNRVTNEAVIAPLECLPTTSAFCICAYGRW